MLSEIRYIFSIKYTVDRICSSAHRATRAGNSQEP